MGPDKCFDRMLNNAFTNAPFLKSMCDVFAETSIDTWIARGDLNMVIQLRSKGHKFNDWTMTSAIRKKQFEIIRWLHNNNCPYNEDEIFHSALLTNDANIIQYIQTHMLTKLPRITEELYKLIISKNALHSFKYLLLVDDNSNTNITPKMVTQIEHSGLFDFIAYISIYDQRFKQTNFLFENSNEFADFDFNDPVIRLFATRQFRNKKTNPKLLNIIESQLNRLKQIMKIVLQHVSRDVTFHIISKYISI